MTSERQWLVFALAAIAAGSLAWLVLTQIGGDDERPEPTASAAEANDEAEVAAFLDAWARFRLGTYVITSEFTRTLDDGSVLSAPRGLAQAPPRRVTSEFANASTSYEDAEVMCVSDELGFFSCLESGLDMAAYQEEVRAEQIVLASYLAGSPPLYVLGVTPEGCFELLIAQAVQLPPYGSRAEFCFDAESGALQRQVIVRESAVDEIVAIEIRTEVTPEDLALEAAS